MSRVRTGSFLGIVSLAVAGCGEPPPAPEAREVPPPAVVPQAVRPEPAPPVKPPVAVKPPAEKQPPGAEALAAGEAAFARREYEDAIAHFTSAVELGHNVSAAKFGRGRAYYAAEKYAKGAEEFRAVGLLGRNVFAAKYNEGLCLYRNGEFAAAVAAFTDAGDAAPDAPRMRRVAERAEAGLTAAKETVRIREAALARLKKLPDDVSRAEVGYFELELLLARAEVASWSWNNDALVVAREGVVAVLDRLHKQVEAVAAGAASRSEAGRARGRLAHGRIALARLTADHKTFVAEHQVLFSLAADEVARRQPLLESGAVSEAEMRLYVQAKSEAEFRLKEAQAVEGRMVAVGLDRAAAKPTLVAMAR